MSKATQKRAARGDQKTSRLTEEIVVSRQHRKTYPITQRGIRTSRDLTDFHAAALADIDSGAADLKEMARMTAITGQILAHENMKLRAGLKKNLFLNNRK